MMSLQVLRTVTGRVRVFMEYSGLVSCLVLSMLFAGGSASSIDSTPEAGARQMLSAVELDALTASGESSQETVVDPSAVSDGFDPRTPGLPNLPASLHSSPNGRVQFPAAQPLTVPNLTQFNGIRQVR